MELMKTRTKTLSPISVILAAAAATAAAALALGSTPAGAAPVAKAVLIGTFDSPVYVAVAPGQPRLLFVVEQTGQIQVLRDEIKLTPAFLDIRSVVLGPPDAGASGEQGLLSMAFAPDYATSRRFYVAFTNLNGDVEIDEYKRSTGDAARADPTTRRKLLAIPHPASQYHNGGQLQFGPDGLLYISVGDSATSPPGEFARNLHSLLGKLLRINPLPTAGKQYRIPADNPFVGTPNRKEIYAYGFRNPWRFTFDGDRIAIADVGQTSREEVNFLHVADASGVNFGWPQYEGDIVFDNTRPGAGPPKFPILAYPHTGGRCAIIGGYVSHDPTLPALKGRYLYGDLCTGQIRSFIPVVATQKANDDKPIGVTVPGLSGFGKGYGGKLYIAQNSGEVSRLAPP